jgi:hypothetical protein
MKDDSQCLQMCQALSRMELKFSVHFMEGGIRLSLSAIDFDKTNSKVCFDFDSDGCYLDKLPIICSA